MPRGGKRPGAGRPKGVHTKHKNTLEKEAAREVLRQLVLAQLEPLVEAHIKHAKGISYLVYREKKGGKFTKVTAENAEDLFKRADLPGDEGGVIIEVWEKEPSTQSFTDLMNRAVDKPAEQLEAKLQHAGSLEIKWQK